MSSLDNNADGLNEKEFEENLKLFESMLTNGQIHFFDAMI